MFGLIAAAFGMAIALVADVAVSRAGGSRIAAYGASFLAGFAAALIAVVAITPQLSFAPVATAVLAYGAWWFIFLNLVQALESSIRVRLVNELRIAGGRMPWSVLQQRYSDTVLLGLRLNRLLAGGAVVERNGCLHVVSPGLKLIAGIFRFLKVSLLGQDSEFGAKHK